MQLCEPHLSDLHTALKLRGLWELQTQTKEEHDEIIAAMNGDAEEVDCAHFDALLAAQFMLFDYAFQIGGFALLEVNDAGDSLCPLCQLKAPANEWIAAVTDEVRMCAAAQGRLPKETMQ